MVRKTRRWQDVDKNDIPLDKLIRTFGLDSRTNHSPQTCTWFSSRLTVFRRWLESQVENLEANVLEKLKIPKPVKQAIETLSEEEIKKLFSAADPNTAVGGRDFAILWTFLDCGLRCSDLANLTLQDAHLEEGYLKVLGKGRKERLGPIGVAAQKALIRYQDHFRPFFEKQRKLRTV